MHNRRKDVHAHIQQLKEDGMPNIVPIDEAIDQCINKLAGIRVPALECDTIGQPIKDVATVLIQVRDALRNMTAPENEGGDGGDA